MTIRQGTLSTSSSRLLLTIVVLLVTVVATLFAAVVDGATLRANNNHNRSDERLTRSTSSSEGEQDVDKRRSLFPSTSILHESSIGFDNVQNCNRDLIVHDMNNDLATNPYLRESAEYFHDYLEGNFTNWFRGGLLQEYSNNPRQMLQTVLSNGKFVFWRFNRNAPYKHRPIFEMSLFSGDVDPTTGTIVSNNPNSSEPNIREGLYRAGIHTWQLMRPDPTQLRIAAQNITTLPEGPKEYIFFVSAWYKGYQHILIDHIGYWSWLNEQFPSDDTHFVFIRNENDPLQFVLASQIDRNFGKRVHFLECQEYEPACSNQLVQAPPGTALSVVTPMLPTRNLDILENARQWLWNKPLFPHPTPDEPKVIIYYKRVPSYFTKNDRYMDPTQEATIIQMIEHAMIRYNRPEQLVILDGSNLKFIYQMELFRKASIVIGPHGGAFANLMMVPPVDATCDNRVKLLEFVKSSETPDVQQGGYRLTYYHLFSTMPWIELHQVYFKPPSTQDTTFIDMNAFGDALNAVMGDGESHHAVSLTSNTPPSSTTTNNGMMPPTTTRANNEALTPSI